MEIFGLLFLSSVSILFGAILTIILQYYVLLKCFKKTPENDSHRKPTTIEACSLPETLKKQINNVEANGTGSANSSIAISLLLQFLFHELRHSENIKQWLYKKLSLEFDELLAKTTTGKFFDAVTIHDMNLGSQFPDITDINIEGVKLNESQGFIDTLNLSLKLDYTGNFLLSVNAKMKFGKAAYLSIKVKKVSGLARLQFTRIPYTHWSFSFYNEPVIELAVESQFQGRQLQTNVTNLIMNQIKKAIKRKHTLPNYKIRYKPFFMKTDPGQSDNDDLEITLEGILQMTCLEVTRLANVSENILTVYFTFNLDPTPWVCLYEENDTCFVIIDITISKQRQQQLGVVFKQELIVDDVNPNYKVTVEALVPNSPAIASGLKVADWILSVDSKTVTNMTQIAKIIKSITKVTFSIRVKRISENYIFKPKCPEENLIKTEEKTPTHQPTSSPTTIDEEVAGDSATDVAKKRQRLSSDKLPKLISNSENVSKLAQTLGNFTLRKRKTSLDRASSEGSNRSTPSVSSPSTPQHIKVQTGPNVLPFRKQTSETKTELEDSFCEIIHTTIDTYKTAMYCFESTVPVNDEFSFLLKDGLKFLNINVWGQDDTNKDVLLGYANIPLVQILNECCNSFLGHFTSCYSFLPPHNVPPTSQTHPFLTHSGFEHVFCYGDILLSFEWKHEGTPCIKRRESNLDDIDTDIKDLPTSGDSKHDFIRTVFHRTTHCDFCSKKIWLKDAVQCRHCAMCCHKKCIAKCQISATCTNDASLRSESSDFSQPEITMTEPHEDFTYVNDIYNGDKLQNFTILNALKRVNSANNLAIPGGHVAQCQSRSLPQTPQHTPGRKQSIVNTNPFLLCPALLELCYQQLSEPDIHEGITQVLDSLLQCSHDESLMDTAKDSGRQLYTDMTHEIRIEKINIMVTELKKLLDSITSEHVELSKQLSKEESVTEKARLAFLVGQMDAKVHALSILMLHYCSGLQQAQDKIV